MAKNVLVTGASGFLGRNLVSKLTEEKNILIYCLIRNGGKETLFKSSPKIKFVIGNITDKDIGNKLPKEIDTIFHLAGIISNSNYEENYRTNVLGTRNIVRVGEEKKVKKLIYSSSINVDLKQGGAYSKTKKLAEKEIKKSKIPTIILRVSQIYGPGDHGFSKIANHVQTKFFLPIIGKGNKFEQPIFVEELISLIILCYKRKMKGKEIFYAAGKDKISFNDLVSYFEIANSKKNLHVHIPRAIALKIARILYYISSNPPITDEQVYHIDTDTVVDMSKTWEVFNYKHYDLKKTLTKLLRDGNYDFGDDFKDGFKNFVGSKLQSLKVLKNLILKRPILIIFDVTKRCNQRCNTCNIWKKGDIENEMTLEEIKNKLNILKKFGVGYAFIQGGDPLLRKDIKDIVLACLERNIKPTIITNGIALNQDLLSFFARHPCNLAISLDTLDEKTYSKIRGVNSLKIVLKNIELARSYKRIGNWAITTTVTQLNYNDVWRLKKFAEERGFMHAIRPYIYHLETAGKADDELIYKQKGKIIQTFRKMIKKTRKNNYLASLIYEGHVDYLIRGDIGRCDALERSFLFQEDGACSPCVEHPNIVFSKDFLDFEEDFKRAKKRLKNKILKCSRETPCFYNDAREIGIIWKSKLKILLHLPRVLKSMIKYGNFF